MEDKDLIQYLRDYTKNYIENGEMLFNPGMAVIIANRFEQLVMLTENDESMLNTSQRLAKTLVQ